MLCMVAKVSHTVVLTKRFRSGERCSLLVRVLLLAVLLLLPGAGRL
jgi:hypothetical protein